MLNKNKIEWIRVWERYRESSSGSKKIWKYRILGVLDRFESAIFHSQFNDLGDFELILPYDLNILSMFSLTDGGIDRWNDGFAISIYLEPIGIDDLYCLDEVAVTTDENGTRRIVCRGVGGLGLMRDQLLGEYVTEGDKLVAITNPIIRGENINASDYFNGKIVAVGAYGLACISEDDGNTWSHLTSLESIASGKTLSAVKWYDASTCYVGGFNVFAKSTDGGYTWERLIISTAPSDMWIWCFAQDNARHIAGGTGDGGRPLIISDLVGTEDSYEVYFPSDTSGSDIDTSLITAMCFKVASNFRAYIILGGGNGKLFVNSEANSFKVFKQIYDTQQSISCIYTLESQTMAFCGKKVVKLSDDGEFQKIINIPSTKLFLRDVAYANGKYIAVGSNSEIWASSDVAETWTKVDYGSYIQETWTTVLYANSKFVVLGWYGDGMQSDNGSTWNRIGITGFNTPFLQNGEAINFIFYLSMAGNNHHTYIRQRLYADTSDNYERRGYRMILDKDDWTTGATVIPSDSYILDMNTNVLDIILSYAQSYKCGFTIKMNQAPFVEITLRDKKQNTNVYLTENMNSVSEQTLTFDLKSICDVCLALGQNDVDKDGNIIQGIRRTGVDNKSTISPINIQTLDKNYPRIKAYQDDYKRTLTFSTQDKDSLYSLLSENAKNQKYSLAPIQYISGKINLKSQSQSNWPFQKKVGLGDVCNIVAYGRVVPVMITGLTYVQDTSGFTIDAEYEGV